MGLSALATLLPPRKHELALKLLLRGERPEPAAFRRQGLDLSAAEAEAMRRFHDRGLATQVAERVRSADGTLRLVVALADGERVETVAMPVGAACLSTQVGCAVRCRFCASGQDGLRRNLTSDEIVEQLVHARRELRIDRVVYMGIGEPTHNLDAVLDAIARIQRDARISYRRQTLSTVGSRRALARLHAAAMRPCLALSLHSADPATRRELLPHSTPDPLPDLVAAADAYGRAMKMPVQFEWTLLQGINDRDQDVEQLAALLRGVRGYVNFIVWNPVAGLPFAAPPRERVVHLVRQTKARGILATIRDSSGADAQAACGQLRQRRA
jgi:23S rRNA (adenine2503-C2)-methyltransferase